MPKKIIKFVHDAGEPKIKKDRIQARCQRTQNNREGSNPGTMSEKPKQNEGIEFRRDTGEPEIKNEGIKSRHNAREPE